MLENKILKNPIKKGVYTKKNNSKSENNDLDSE